MSNKQMLDTGLVATTLCVYAALLASVAMPALATAKANARPRARHDRVNDKIKEAREVATRLSADLDRTNGGLKTARDFLDTHYDMPSHVDGITTPEYRARERWLKNRIPT